MLATRQEAAYKKAQHLEKVSSFRSYVDMMDCGTPDECFIVCRMDDGKVLHKVRVWENTDEFWTNRLTTI